MPLKIPEIMRLASGESAGVVETEEQENRFTMLAYTGAPVKSAFGPMIVDLGGMELSASVPILLNHEASNIAGLSDSITIGDQGLKIEGSLYDCTASGREVKSLSAEKFPWQASMGFQVEQVKQLGDEESFDVNGQTFEGPGIVITQSKLLESSFVPLGRDDNTSASAFGVGDGFLVFDKGDDEMSEKKNAPQSASISELRASFGDKPEFVLEQFEAGATIEAAELAYLKLSLKQNEEDATAQAMAQAEELAKLTEQLAAKTSEIASISNRGHEGVSFSASPLAESLENFDLVEVFNINEARKEWTHDKSLRTSFGRFGKFAQAKKDWCELDPDHREIYEKFAHAESTGAIESFDGFQAYISYKSAEESGLVKFLSR